MKRLVTLLVSAVLIVLAATDVEAGIFRRLRARRASCGSSTSQASPGTCASGTCNVR
jgi:hypothetical protein